MRAVSWIVLCRRAYVPVFSLLLTILLGNWLAAVARRNIELKAEERSQREAVARGAGLSAADLAVAQAVFTPADDSSARASLLYLGDSQVFSRPDAPSGSLNTAQWLQILLARQDGQAARVHIGATPGMDIPEMLLRTAASIEPPSSQHEIVIIDLALAELRDLGVRSEIQSLVEEQGVSDALRNLVAANPDLADAAKTLTPLLNKTAAGPDGRVVQKSMADRMEDELQARAQGWPLFAQRENLMALGLLRYAQLEHRLLHISSADLIPTPAVPYHTNLQVLELLMRYARSRGIHLILFFGPVRDLKPNPDAPADLARMRLDVSRLCQRYGVTCLDYSHAVPEAYWANYAANQRGAFAMMAGQHDFYHFIEAGHKLLAEKLFADAGPEILRWSNAAGGSQ